MSRDPHEPLNPWPASALDQDAVLASVDLVRRSGTSEIEFGFLYDGVAVEDADWWAHAKFRGVHVTVEHHQGPVEALEALARRLLAGALCRRCGEPVQLSDDAAGCRWRRQGDRWTPGCGKPIDYSIPAAGRGAA